MLRYYGMRVAIQGDIASFHHQAAKKWYGADVEIVPAESFSETFGLAARHEADSLIVAIENSLYGSIHQVYDLLEAYRFPIVGEVHLRIHHQLITLSPSVEKAEIKQIYSHPVALAQCENYLDANYAEAERLEYHDTAAAVEFIKSQNNPSLAAVASVEAAELHGLHITEHNIEDNKANFTRFLVAEPNSQPPRDADRTSLVLVTDHTPGALARILTIIADNGVDLSKLQSRPITGKPWNYRFYLVVDTAGDLMKHISREIKPYVRDLTILGEYKHNL